MKKNFSLSVTAHSFATEIKKEKGNPQEYRELAQLGLAIGFKDKNHLDIEKTTLKKNITDTETFLMTDQQLLFTKAYIPILLIRIYG